MPLTGDEAPSFGRFTTPTHKETIKVNDERYALIKEYATTYATLTDAQAASYILAVEWWSTRRQCSSAWHGFRNFEKSGR